MNTTFPGRFRQVLAYLALQISAGFTAGLACYLFFQVRMGVGPRNSFGFWDAACLELLYTAMLAYVILAVVASRTAGSQQNHVFGVAIGLVLLAASPCEPISGAILNPAASLGLEVAGGGQHGPYGLAYALLQLLGGALAVLAFQTRRSPAKDLLAEFMATFLPFGARDTLI